MEKNKSIDGLEVRRSKKVVKNSSIDGLTVKKKTIKNPSTMPDFNKKTVAKKPATKPVVKPVTKPATKPAKKSIKPVIEVEEPEIKEENIEIIEEMSVEKNPDASATDFLSPVNMFEFDSESGQLKQSEEPMKKISKKELKKSKKNDAEFKLGDKKKKKSKKRTIIWTIILFIIVLILGAACWLCLWGNDIIAKITGGQGNVIDAIGALMSDTYNPLKADEKGRTNILVFGTSGYNMDGDEGNGTHDGAQLTDSIMMISIDQNTGDIAMTSLPRDLKASPTCTATGKINEVYWCHNQSGDNEAAGAEALMEEAGSVFGVDFQYFVHINWSSLIQIVDTIGGITVTLDEGIYDYDYTGAVYDPGVAYNLDGAQALGLARARHGTTGGDFSRGNSQQKILIGIKDKIYESNLSLFDTMNLVSVLGDNLRSNLSVDEIKTAAHLTFEFDFDKIRQVPLVDYENNIYYFTTGTINGISYVLPSAGVGNYAAIHNYIAENLITPVEEELEEIPKEIESTTEEE